MNLQNYFTAAIYGLVLGTVSPLALADACTPACGKVESVTQKSQQGKSSAVGVLGGALVGGLLGNQVGGGSGKTVATIAGAAGGAYAGSAIEKKAGDKTITVVTVKMDDGQTQTFDFETEVPILAGDRVQVVNGQLKRYAGK
jgi:outer membrane lipoprotein SlyB